jgi:hypothetical protein
VLDLEVDRVFEIALARWIGRPLRDAAGESVSQRDVGVSPPALGGRVGEEGVVLTGQPILDPVRDLRAVRPVQHVVVPVGDLRVDPVPLRQPGHRVGRAGTFDPRRAEVERRAEGAAGPDPAADPVATLDDDHAVLVP